VLNASRNALTVVPAELAALSRLVDLDLSRNAIAALQPRLCSGLAALKFLNLMGNRLAGEARALRPRPWRPLRRGHGPAPCPCRTLTPGSRPAGAPGPGAGPRSAAGPAPALLPGPCT
jgi:hypothetical protein